MEETYFHSTLAVEAILDGELAEASHAYERGELSRLAVNLFD